MVLVLYSQYSFPDLEVRVATSMCAFSAQRAAQNLSIFNSIYVFFFKDEVEQELGLAFYRHSEQMSTLISMDIQTNL